MSKAKKDLASMSYYIYMITNKTNKVLYTGVTNDLIRRIYEHKNNLNNGFAQKYNLKKLVYFEQFDDIHYAISREKEIKGWLRKKKDLLISKLNPDWRDLSLKFEGDSSALSASE